MAHFAELNSDNLVIGVYKVENAVITDENKNSVLYNKLDFTKNGANP